ncbi:hypothetical protein CDD83_10581 [Cordyceps sp. RAO-2017]|nr:hypothetical protein CDD83_10581 [Cordyceps sp. RAO-2017]
MPSAATRRVYEDQIPTFMSVFDLDADIMADRETVTLVDSKLVSLEPKVNGLVDATQPALGAAIISSEVVHKHNDSTSTQMSESTESSPTTTLSTTDSSPLSDPSPSSSPDSPVNLIPLNNYPCTSFGCQSGYGTMVSIPETGTLERPMTSPAPRRPRNMKGLSIQPPANLTAGSRTFATEPSSPSFIKPKIPAMKRKPSQLSLKTSTSDLMKNPTEMPASPAMPPILHRRALKHSTSSPHMLAGLRSSAFGPSGGMTFPKVLERNESGLSEVLRPMKSSANANLDAAAVSQRDSPIKTQHVRRADFEPHQGSPNNEDQKSPGYPDGPVAIYGDNVFLYSEPTAEEAARFDVVINVAREVKNPFDAPEAKQHSFPWYGRPLGPTASDDSPCPDTAVTTASFATAFEFQPLGEQSSDTPTTPKAPPSQAPEYIHVLWDHNTDIASDLMRLCETIETRTNEGKKVLVHCQQGASRSASLIIAYGLYQNPQLSVNDAYYAAQSKSRWISPNMKLMYSLQDFYKELSKKRLPPTSVLRPRVGRSPTKHRLTLSADAIDITSKEPQTAPLPGEGDDGNDGPDPMAPRGRVGPTSGIQAVSPGPASAPLTCSWRSHGEDQSPKSAISSKMDELPQRPKLDTTTSDSFLSKPGAARDQTDRQMQEMPDSLPDRDGYDERQDQLPDADAGDRPAELQVLVASSYPADEALMSPRVEAMTNNPLSGFHHVGGMRFLESPATPTAGLFSPRDISFPRDAFSFFGRASHFGRPPQVVDPRSPPTRGETPIIRSIDDVL